MDVNNLLDIFSSHPTCQKLIDTLSDIDKKEHIYISGLKGSSKSILFSNVVRKSNNCHLVILPDKEQAYYFANDVIQCIESSRVFVFPSSYKHPGQNTVIDQSAIIQRSEILNFFSQQSEHYSVVVTYPEAFAEKVIATNILSKNTLTINKGEKYNIQFIRELLEEYGFQRSDFVYEPGQYSIRGSIVDVFSFSTRFPFRIDFLGNEVDSIRSFDIESQLSIDKLEKVHILPNIQQISPSENRVTLLEYLPSNTWLWLSDSVLIEESIHSLEEKQWQILEEDIDQTQPEVPILLHLSEYRELIKKYSILEFVLQGNQKNRNEFVFDTSPQPLFHKKFELLVSHLSENKEKGYQTIICSDSEKQLERLKAIFSSIDSGVNFEPIQAAFHEGFMDYDLKICLYTDHQIFERYQKSKFDGEVKTTSKNVLTEISDLHPGDYVVHIDHGIGIFAGIEKVEINGKWQEVIKLVYKDNDVLYVGVNSLHRISKYRGKDGEPPRVYKLGTGAWHKLKQATKKKIKDISRELISLYAKRIETQGFSFSPDTYLQQELEASFIYEDTPDQEKATKIVKQGMEGEHPADILVCGDVGFGKTEIAIRAAFKAAVDNKQTAVLVPTTILAIQHYNTFSERLKDFPVKVDYISRVRKPSEIRSILKKLETGEIDILIGTHKILGSNVKFKDLGLLIVDEEQKFGVAMKEKLKALKVNIDCISLTATPIPRTLQFSLMGARDLAILNTPPPDRFPVVTEVYTFDDQIIRQGILNEMARGGQVFFIHNRVHDIYELEKKLKNIVPEARFVVTHGQMAGEDLENNLFAFIRGDYDVLLTTSIIESGVDIPNVNTIFVMDAHHFGLSDLHQLRGRVGRSNRKAFCYLLIPSVHSLTSQAKRRLKAIEENSDLGSGFNISMLDLDIRGAGNLLGAEQSGFIAEIGYETYLNILNEAIQEVKEEDYRELFFSKNADSNQPEKEKINVLEQNNFVLDCQIDTDLEIMLPESYIENITERIRLYRELDGIKTEDELLAFEKMLVDRFGPIPPPAIQLMDIVRLRKLAIQLGFERISIKNEQMTIYFVSNQQSLYYQSDIFGKILSFVQKHPNIFTFKESSAKPSMYTKGIKSVKMAIETLEKILKSQSATSPVS
jgi:transcription-repair coupling factor (superfamily II helicase)